MDIIYLCPLMNEKLKEAGGACSRGIEAAPLTRSSDTKITQVKCIDQLSRSIAYCKCTTMREGTAGMTTHAAQALVDTGYASNDKAMDAAVGRIVRVHIFEKVKFTVDSDFSTDGKLFRVCSRKYVKGGGNREDFKNHWTTKNGWKIARSTINSKRNGIQDSVRKHAIKCKVFVLACYHD